MTSLKTRTQAFSTILTLMCRTQLTYPNNEVKEIRVDIAGKFKLSEFNAYVETMAISLEYDVPYMNVIAKSYKKR